MYKLNGNRIIIERIGTIAHIRYRKNHRHIYILIKKNCMYS